MKSFVLGCSVPHVSCRVRLLSSVFIVRSAPEEVSSDGVKAKLKSRHARVKCGEELKGICCLGHRGSLLV